MWLERAESHTGRPSGNRNVHMAMWGYVTWSWPKAPFQLWLRLQTTQTENNVPISCLGKKKIVATLSQNHSFSFQLIKAQQNNKLKWNWFDFISDSRKVSKVNSLVMSCAPHQSTLGQAFSSNHFKGVCTFSRLRWNLTLRLQMC